MRSCQLTEGEKIGKIQRLTHHCTMRKQANIATQKKTFRCSLFTGLKLVPLTYSYPYQLITILDVQIGYNHADIAAQKKTCRFSLFTE